MARSSSGLLQYARRAWGSSRKSERRGQLRGVASRNWLRVESLESRNLLATLYAANADDFTITSDIGAAGLSAGDTVTFETTADSAHGSADVTGLVFGTNAFTSIQGAVDAAATGDTIRVGAGTFVESVNVNKDVTLLGNQAEVDAQTGRVGANETIVTGAGNNGVTPIVVSADNVEINGFTVQGATNVNQFGAGIFLGTTTSGTEIRNNIVQNNIIGLFLANDSAAGQTVIEGNLFRDNNQAGPASGNAIYADEFTAGGDITNVLINNNTFINNDTAGVNLATSSAASANSNITISNNVFDENGNAINLTNTLNSTITGNEITDSTGSQIAISGGVSGLTITENVIANGDSNGIRILGSGNQNITINRNSITGNPTAIRVETGAFTGTINAEANFFGSASGPGANAIVAPAGQVDFTPFLTSGTDTQTGVRGFQPLVPQVDLAVTKTSGSGNVTAGGTVTYVIVVSNNGASAVTGATVADTFPAGFTVTSISASGTGGASGFASGGTTLNQTVDLPVGSTITYTVTGTVAAGATGTITNTATVTAPGTVTDVNANNNTAIDTDTVGGVTGQTDLSVTKSNSVSTVSAGSTVTYTIVVTNNGPTAVTGASVEDSIGGLNNVQITAAGTGGASGFTSGGTTIDQTVTLPVGSTITYTVTGTVPAGASGSLSNSASVSAAGGVVDVNASNNVATDTDVIGATPVSADLSITKTNGVSTVTPGGAVTYTIVVANNGPASVTGATVTDVLPSGFTVFSVTQTGGASGAASGGTSINQTVNLPVGSTIVYTVTGTVPAGATGSLSNTARVTAPAGVADANASNNVAVDTDEIDTDAQVQADLSITKTSSASTVSPGDTVTYTIVVTNNSAATISGATVTDVFPGGLTGVQTTAVASAGSSTTIVSPLSGNLNDTVTLAPGGTVTYTVTGTVGASATGNIANAATVNAPAGVTDTNPTNNVDVETDVVIPVDDGDELVCEVTTLNLPGDPGTASIEADLDNVGGTALIVTGTSGNDVIIIEPRGRNQIRVLRNGRTIGVFNRSEVQRIVAFGLSGNDKIIVNASLFTSATLFGDAGNDQLFGARGNDELDGGDGNDKLFGGAGNDELCGGDGNDFLYGQQGNDTLGGDDGNDHIFGESGNDLIFGNEGNDKLFGGTGNDRVFGQEGNDQLFGESGNDILVGGVGNDKMFGGSGRDLLIGGEDNDQLNGESGDDILIGGSTAFDEDLDALDGIMGELASTNYGTRVSNLRTGAGSSGIALDDSSVFDDLDFDSIIGSSNLDWFLVGESDRVRDRARNELVN